MKYQYSIVGLVYGINFDFRFYRQASVLAVVSTLIAIIIIIIQLVLDMPDHPNPSYSLPEVGTFSLGFSAILFAFGGASAFPTLQNDMEDRTQWWKSVCIGFSGKLKLDNSKIL